ncbi:XRCC4-like factor-domain-containing protein [Clohesyomyces aquaticus]|uniref:Non-homologous end-joining factor 1 n=1 Tax=Clohesyomyces aquaticus TaxID=1231657 RepID=A0A1Y1ZA18_9PLEO|nr:XRCC4-like factor-domain-containing protein [Clohesyomyces aquaticus]
MACWRLLPLTDCPKDQYVPQLLIKPEFGSHEYTVFLTDLGNIWSETLDLDGIMERASQEGSPIEVSKQDTNQLAILLDHLQASLTRADDTSCRVTRDNADGITLHTTTRLPEPLGPLRWKFILQKKTPVALKNELILPLLVSSHIQHERVSGLVATIKEKDRAIARLLDQYESSNLDLASAFPSIAGSKPGRRLVKREQAARHVPALEPFHEEVWRKDTGQLRDAEVSTLGLFQEALVHSTPRVPHRLLSGSGDPHWWSAIPAVLQHPQASKDAKPTPPKQAPRPKRTPSPASSEEDTEDEFETHENFHLRNLLGRRLQQPPEEIVQEKLPIVEASEGETTTDDEDLDAAPQRPSQNLSQPQKLPTVNTVHKHSPSSSPQPSAPPVQKSKGFKIGGAKAKREVVGPPASTSSDNGTPLEGTTSIGNDSMPSRLKAETGSISAGQKTPKKAFKIGGKHKDAKESGPAPGLEGGGLDGPVDKNKEAALPGLMAASTTRARDVSTPAVAGGQAGAAVEEEHEETAEEKAGRKRHELKRKNEELAKKQAQKKKKRF